MPTEGQTQGGGRTEEGEGRREDGEKLILKEQCM